MANRVRSTALISGVAVVAVLLLMAQRGQAQTVNVASDRAAGYVVFPKVLVDSSDIFIQGRRVDTLMQLTSTAVPSGSDTGCRVVECFYVNATKHCTNSNTNLTPNGPCRTNADCLAGGTCGLNDGVDGWQETNFFVVLSASQPVGWSANSGGFIPPDADACADGQFIPGAPEAFFIGEVKCVEVDGTALTGPGATTGTPILANELKGEATIYDIEPGTRGGVATRAYNGIGIPATSTSGQPIAKTCVGGTNQGGACVNDAGCPGGACEVAMCLGSNPTTGAVCSGAAAPTHASCPSTLILNHFFDFAPNLLTGICSAGTNTGSLCTTDGECGTGGVCVTVPVHTDLTLVPCSEDLTKTGPAATPATTAQFLVFNEFEQRFSASLTVRCFKEIQLSNIDTLPGNEVASIFSIYVQGTLTGQTRIRPVIGSELDVGHGLLGVAEEFMESPVRDGVSLVGSDAFNLNYAGTTLDKADVVVLPPDLQ
jgi:hypothetical protein